MQTKNLFSNLRGSAKSMDKFLPAAAAAIFKFLSTRGRDLWQNLFAKIVSKQKTLLNKETKLQIR
jgi:hypothetical protein